MIESASLSKRPIDIKFPKCFEDGYLPSIYKIVCGLAIYFYVPFVIYLNTDFA